MTRKFTPTHLQERVINLLAIRGEAAATDWTAWYPMSEQQVRGILRGLSRRSVVDVAGFDDRARTFKLTEYGWEVANSLVPPEDLE